MREGQGSCSRRMKSAMPGAVEATMPCSGAWTRPFAMSFARAGPKLLARRPSRPAIRPDALPWSAVGGHRLQVLLLRPGGPVPARAEEPVVECGSAPHGTESSVDQRQPGAGRVVPRAPAELLEEVRVPRRLLHDEVHGVGVPGDTFTGSGLDERGPGQIALQVFDPLEDEEPLRVGLRLGEDPGEARQPSTGQDRVPEEESLETSGWARPCRTPQEVGVSRGQPRCPGRSARSGRRR